ncbi:hypothetical protein HYC85_024227 [Camellia sinensis]|uniref:Uncharacterized protein n=1 Tax=Camellia sinensis TaxID=4442 RepID=A0A7J7G9V8_CAMSI|nr:hypothetical protein HYC85_024227 [Camellia sinensis]
MKVQGVEKISPRSSWIEMDSKINLFEAFDKSHPYLAKIYVVLGELNGQLKLAGYQPEVGKHNDGPTSTDREEWHAEANSKSNAVRGSKMEKIKNSRKLKTAIVMTPPHTDFLLGFLINYY